MHGQSFVLSAGLGLCFTAKGLLVELCIRVLPVTGPVHQGK